MTNATPPRRQALLCPRCRKLVSADERLCPHCGLTAPGAWWKKQWFRWADDNSQGLLHGLIAVNGFMYLLCLLTSPSGLGLSGNPMTLLAPDLQGVVMFGATGTLPIDRLHRWWTLGSASFLHGGLLHLLFNMLALRQLFPVVQREYGASRLMAIYILSGVGGFLVSYLAGVVLTIGASAAVCGLIGALLYYGKSRGGIYGQIVYRQVGGWALGIFLFGWLVPGINNWAHGGGMAAGMVLGLLLGYGERRRETWHHRLLGGGCLIATGAVLLWAVVSGLSQRFG